MATLVVYLVVTSVPYSYAADTPLIGGLPYLPVAAAVVAIVLALAIAIVGRPRPLLVIGALGYGVAIATALLETGAEPMRDLKLYLDAGRRFIDGEAVYLAAPLTAAPADPSGLPYLYPPPTLPLFAALASMPPAVSSAVWAGASLAALVVAMRAIGVSPIWLPAFLLWRPAFDGLWAGNVAPFMFVLFAIGPMVGAALPFSASFKLYNGIAALWLVRMRRWRSIAIAAAVLGVIVVATIPLTGIEMWSQWLAGLGYYQESQAAVPGLYGMSLASWLSPTVALALGIGVTALALLPAGREGLARLGLATIVASPSLFTPGFLWAVPSMASASLTLALASFVVMAGPAQWAAWWVPVILLLASWGLAVLRRPDEDRGEPDPFADRAVPWPGGSVLDQRREWRASS